MATPPFFSLREREEPPNLGGFHLHFLKLNLVAPGLESTTSNMAELKISEPVVPDAECALWLKNYKLAEKAKKAIMELVKDLEQEYVSEIIWELAESKGIIIVQTYTAEHLGLEEGTMPDVRRVHEVLSNCDFVNVKYEVQEVVEDIIRENESTDDESTDDESTQKEKAGHELD